MSKSYYGLREADIEDIKTCQFDWDCENCPLNLCINLVAVAKIPCLYRYFMILRFDYQLKLEPNN